MKYDKITIIGVVGCLLAFVLLTLYMPRPVPRKAAAPAPAEQTAGEAATTAETASPDGTTAGEPGHEPAAAVDTAAGKALSLGGGGVARWPEPARPPVELRRPDEATLLVDPDGGGVVGVWLDQYFQDKPRNGETGEHVVLGAYDHPFMVLDTAASGLDFAPQGSGRMEDGAYVLSRRSRDGHLELTERWWPGENTYEFHYEFSLKNDGEIPLALDELTVSGGALPPSVSPARKAGRGESAGGASAGTPNSHARMFTMRDIAKMKPDTAAALRYTPATWTAVHSKYFLLGMWLADSDLAGVEVKSIASMSADGVQPAAAGRYAIQALLPKTRLDPGASGTWTLTGYAGPKNFERLHAMRNGLDNIMEMDRFFFFRPAWMGWLSRCLLLGLVWISKCFPPSLGYGLGIIFLTLLVKVIFWPLSHKSTVSMRKMQALQPQLKELRDKYKDDPQKLYRKQNELYKENNVNQLGGCLPMLLQIPVFFALFNTFRNAVELRQAGFLWANDLSLPDTLSFSPEILPIRPLAILMGVTMYLQQKMTPSADPKQAQMMNMMSVFFVVLFYGMPSALTLYMSVSYLLGMAQTMLIRKMEKNGTEVTVTAPAAKTK